MKAAQIIGVALLTMAATASVRADWRIDAETGVLYNSNLSNSDRDSDVKDAWDWRSHLRIGNGFQLTRDLRLNVGADLDADKWARFYDFNNVAPGGTLSFRYRFGLGREAPWLLVGDNLGYAFYHDEGRSGRDNSLRVAGGFGFCERFSLEADYTFDDFDAKEEFWDWSANSGTLRLTYNVNSSFQLGLAYTYRDGVFVSYARPPRPDLVFFQPERELVDTFGTPQYMAYRLRGPTNVVSASAIYILNKYMSIQLSYEFRHTSHDSLEYVNHLVEAKIGFAY